MASATTTSYMTQVKAKEEEINRIKREIVSADREIDAAKKRSEAIHDQLHKANDELKEIHSKQKDEKQPVIATRYADIVTKAISRSKELRQEWRSLHDTLKSIGERQAAIKSELEELKTKTKLIEAEINQTNHEANECADAYYHYLAHNKNVLDHYPIMKSDRVDIERANDVKAWFFYNEYENTITFTSVTPDRVDAFHKVLFDNAWPNSDYGYYSLIIHPKLVN